MIGAPFIRANRVSLRDFLPEDIDDVASIVGDERVTHWLSFETKDRAGAASMIAAAMSSSQLAPRTEFYLAVVNSTGSQLIGFVRLATNGASTAKIGYAIHADHWRNGYATEAARAVINFGFTDLGLHRITAAVGPDNHASQGVLKRLGFVEEGRLRDHVFTNGAWRDSVLYSILRNEQI